MNKSESKYYNTALLMDEALLLLLEKKEYEFITVKEICAKAGVNRSTFYLHYESIDDLLNETLEMVSNKFFSTFDHKVINPKSATKDELFLIDDEYLIPYLKLIKTHKTIYKLIHNKPEVFNNQKAFKKLYHDLFDEILNSDELYDENFDITNAAVENCINIENYVSKKELQEHLSSYIDKENE